MAEMYWTCKCGITRRSFDSARCSRSKRRGSSGARCASTRNGARIVCEHFLVVFGEGVGAASDVSQLTGANAQVKTTAVASAASAIDSDRRRRDGDAETRPDRRRAPGRTRSAPAQSARRRVGSSPCWNSADHRRRRVARRAFPDAALHGRNEIEDPRADGHAERQDRGGRGMFRDDRRGGRPARSSARR